jgi:Fe2+ transport system protein B
MSEPTETPKPFDVEAAKAAIDEILKDANDAVVFLVLRACAMHRNVRLEATMIERRRAALLASQPVDIDIPEEAA